MRGSKQKDISSPEKLLIMTWPTKKLGEEAYFQEGPGLRTFQFKSTGIRVINVANVREGFLDLSKTKFLDTTEVEQKYKHFLVNKDDILVSTSGTIGRVAWVEKENLPLMLNTSVVRFHTLDEKSLLNRFLFYFLNDSLFRNELLKYKTGVAIFNVGPSHIKKIKIPLPPLAIQKQIVERMDKIAEAQKLNNDLIQKSDELFLSLLHKELNSKSKNWEIKKLGEVADFINGKAFKPKDWGKKGLPIIRIQNLNNKDASFNYYNDKVEEKYLVQDGDLLFSWSGNIGTSFGAFIWKRGNALLNQHIFNIKIKNIDLGKGYFYFFINKIIAEIEGKTHGITGLVHITKGTLGKIKIPLPPLKIQNQIVEKLSAAQEYKKQLLAQKSLLKELFDSVLHKSMNGEYEKSH